MEFFKNIFSRIHKTKIKKKINGKGKRNTIVKVLNKYASSDITQRLRFIFIVDCPLKHIYSNI